ncbi:DMT family transporter [Kiloniella majae]|uniref:DMT family transporter n=1 Tax=Kiloniella majae TaxID=1938558 RepID=UPI000A2793BC|nr:DMT family transporter [Kiloniella majae]
MKYLPMLAFGGLGVIWGSNFIYMKMASELISSSQIVLLRVLFGFLPIFFYAYLIKVIKLSHMKHVGHFFVMSLLATVAYYYGFAKGASLLLSGVAGALSGTIPIFALLLGLLFISEERLSINRAIGLLVGLFSVFLIANPFSGNLASTNIEGVIYMVFGSLSIGASFVYAKKYVLPLKISSTALTTYQLGVALLILCVVTDYEGIGNISSDLHVLVGIVVGLGLLGTGIAYLIYYYIIEKLGAISASSVTYIPPVVALIIGAVIVGEDIRAVDYFATGLIFLAVMLVNKKNQNTAK